MKLYEIHNSSSVSPTASKPVKLFMLFLPSERIFKFSAKGKSTNDRVAIGQVNSSMKFHVQHDMEIIPS